MDFSGFAKRFFRGRQKDDDLEMDEDGYVSSSAIMKEGRIHDGPAKSGAGASAVSGSAIQSTGMPIPELKAGDIGRKGFVCPKCGTKFYRNVSRHKVIECPWCAAKIH